MVLFSRYSITIILSDHFELSHKREIIILIFSLLPRFSLESRAMFTKGGNCLARERRRAKQSGGVESGENAPRK